MSTKTKPTIAFCHGLWADGSCFNKVIPVLQADGHEVIAVQYGLDNYEEDLATVTRTLNRVGRPVTRAKVERSRSPFDSFEGFVLPALVA
jgi:hypothetical protein